MTFVVADRVQENGTVATGTGSVNLAGAVNGYQTFASGIGAGNTTYYTIYDPAAYTWEVGLGTVGSGTLARTTVYANSAGTAPSKISFSTSNTLTVFVTYPAETAIYTGSSASLNSLALTSPITSSSNKGALNYGTLTYSDTNIFQSYQTSVNSYAQLIIQNSSAGSAASADIVVSSDSGTASVNYGNFGINSTGYTGTGPLNSPSMVYLYSQSYDLTIGTNTSNAIHFTINNSATDAMTINTSGSIAINGQTGSVGQVLISQGSSNPPSWGNAGGNLVVTDFTATAGQTTFTVSYVVGTVSVYRNGIKLGLADYTATNGSTVVLATGAAAGDLIEIQSFTTLTLFSSITSQDFSGNGSTTAFTMNTNPANSASVLVSINGVVQDPANYTVSGNTLTFTTAPATGTNNISCRYLGLPSTTSVSSFSAGTTGFSPTTAASGAVTLSGILVPANGGTGVNITNTDLVINSITVGKGNYASADDTAVGYQALTTNSSGTGDTAVGYQALKLNTSGSDNTGMGAYALAQNTTGGTNSAYGGAALYSNTTGGSNTALGKDALRLNTTASGNTAVGYQAGYSGTTAQYNQYFGYQAGYSTSTGSGNNAFGTQALKAVTTGQLNAAMGNSALISNTTGSNNIGIGDSALYNNTTASNNTAVGYQAGYSNTTTTYNTFVGYQAGYALNGTFGSNTFIGTYAGNAVTTGYNNTIIGSYTGNQGGLDIRTASNYIVLSDGAGNPRGIFAGNRFYINSVGQNGNTLQVMGMQYNGSVEWGLSFQNTYSGNTGSAINFNNFAGTQVGTIQPGASSTAYVTTSDYRLKENVKPATNALDIVAKLNPVTFNWKETGEEELGFIAHELQEVIPHAVRGEKDAVNEDGSIKAQGIDTSFIVATLTAAIKELNAKVTTLEEQLKAK